MPSRAPTLPEPVVLLRPPFAHFTQRVSASIPTARLVTGTIHQAVPLRSAPEYLVSRADRLFVRTYNTDAVFRLSR